MINKSKIYLLFLWIIICNAAIFFQVVTPRGLPSLLYASTSVLPEEEDGPLQVWQSKEKYIVVITMDESSVPGIRTIQKLLGLKDISTTMISTHVLNKGGPGIRSPLDGL
jgi:hypothetical protein